MGRPRRRGEPRMTITVTVPVALMTWADEWGKDKRLSRGQVITEALEALREMEEPENR